MTEPGALLDVQRLDNLLDQLRYRHEHLPERASLAALAADEAKLDRATEATRTHRDDLRRQERELEDDANDLDAKAKRLDAKLYDGSITSPKEATAMNHEIAGLKERQGDLEEQAIEILTLIEPLDEQLVQAEAARGEMTAKRTELEASLAAETAAIEAEIADVESQRTAAVAVIDDERLTQYAKLRITYGPDAIVEFDAGKGGGCPVAMSAVELDRWKHSPAGLVDFCVDCGRLVVKLD